MIEEKAERLRTILRSMERAVIAYSGGVDSTLLAKVAYDVLGENVVAVTASSETYPSGELEEAIRIARAIGIQHEVVESEELTDPNFAENPADRCYYCKRELLGKLREIADRYGVPHILLGANEDDRGDFRPGMKAAEEMGARSPLQEVGMTKADIRALSKSLGLPTWDKPQAACLSSRFPYGTRITPERLTIVDQAEHFLRELGFRQLRVRHHGDTARIEVPSAEMDRLLDGNLREQVADRFRELGYTYVTVDLAGYRTGSMNEVLPQQNIEHA